MQRYQLNTVLVDIYMTKFITVDVKSKYNNVCGR